MAAPASGDLFIANAHDALFATRRCREPEDAGKPVRVLMTPARTDAGYPGCCLGLRLHVCPHLQPGEHSGWADGTATRTGRLGRNNSDIQSRHTRRRKRRRRNGGTRRRDRAGQRQARAEAKVRELSFLPQTNYVAICGRHTVMSATADVSRRRQGLSHAECGSLVTLEGST